MNAVARAISSIRGVAISGIGPIGVDIALEEIHLVQLQLTSAGIPTLRARVSLPLDSPRREILASPLQFRSLVRRALEADDFSGRCAVLALPSGMFRTVSINYQTSNDGEGEAEMVVRTMQERLDGEISDYVLDYMPVRNRSKSEERLAVVAVSERSTVVNYLELARKAGLHVQNLEIGPVAIGRLIGTVSSGDEVVNSLILNFGRRACYLTLMSGSDLLFDQEVDVGENSLIQRISETLDMSENMARSLVSRSGVWDNESTVSDATGADSSGLLDTLSEILKPQFLNLVDEIRRALLYAASETRGGAKTQVYLLGSIARWPGSAKLLSGLAGVDVRKIPDPPALFTETHGNDSLIPSSAAPEIAVATGLALRSELFNV